MIEKEAAVRPAFVNCTTGHHKDIECIQEMKALCTKKCDTGEQDVTLRQKV